VRQISVQVVEVQHPGVETVATGPVSGPPGQRSPRLHLGELPILGDLVLPVLLLVAGPDQCRPGRNGWGDEAFDNDDAGAATQVEGDSGFFQDGVQDGQAGRYQETTAVTPKSPYRSGMGMTVGTLNPVSPGARKLLVDPQPRQRCPVGHRAPHSRRFFSCRLTRVRLGRLRSGAVDASSYAPEPNQGRPYVGLDDQTARNAMAAPVCGESHIMPLPA
jgi:hypothetical protein